MVLIKVMRNNNKFRINHPANKQPPTSRPPPPSLSSFFTEAVQAVKEKASHAFATFQSKLSETPAVFSMGKDDRQKELSVGQVAKDRDSSISKNSQILKGRAKSNLNRQDGVKLKQLINRKQELMQRLRKIDYQLLNPAPTLDIGQSQASAQSRLRQYDSRLKAQQSRVYNPLQHEKTIEMLSRLNNEKIKRQERIVHDMKRKQEEEIKKLTQIQNKSHLNLSRKRHPTPLVKFNTKQTENPTFDRKTNSVASSNHKLQQKIENEFDELPQLVTCQKQIEEKQPIQEDKF